MIIYVTLDLLFEWLRRQRSRSSF